MPQNALDNLALSPDQCVSITGSRRTRLISFLLRWEQHETALACLEQMLASSPDLVGLMDSKARALLGLGKADAALEVMQARHQIRSSLSSQALQARIHLARGDSDSAREIARHLTTGSPDSIMAWNLLGAVHLACNDLESAQDALHRLAGLQPGGRTYLLAMLAFHEARGDLVTASGYAVRLQRTAAEGQPLPAPTLRRLRDYYQGSGEVNRVQEIEAELAALYKKELGELATALGRADEEAERERIRQQSPPVAATDAVPDVFALQETIQVSDEERRRIGSAVRELFGFGALLPGQAETMAAALRQEDVLTVLPTGGGKSLCYQVPALLDDSGTTLVISPLIALMKDQVDSLPTSAQPSATTINSSLDGRELHHRMQGVTAGRYRLIYAAPERLRQPPFLHALRRCGVNRLVIDEAHCVSVWGHDFRPDYLTINRARQALGNPPLLAMTATAPPRVRQDIVQRMRNEEGAGPDADMAIVTAEIHRPNLFLAAVQARNMDEKLQYLLSLCAAEKGSGIVYAGTRARCEEIAALLRSRGMSAGHYHAGIGDRAARAAAQDDFMGGRVRIIVATIAFGMGIDKPDIRFIIHLQLPSSLEAYYQEAGRAGRDGQPARCVLIYSTSDRATLTRRVRRDALSVEFLQAVQAAVDGRLGNASLGRVASDDLMRDLRAEDTPVRVALSTLEEAGLLRRHQDIARTAVVRLPGSSGRPREDTDEAWSRFVSAARLQPRQQLPLDLMGVAERAGLDPTRVEHMLLTWADAGWIEYRSSGRDLLLERLRPPSDASARLQALVDRHASIQAQRVDEIAAYAATARCRHGHINAYLSGKPMAGCGSCDNCRPHLSPVEQSATSAGLPSEGEQFQTILRCAEGAPWSWGRVSLMNILRGSPRAPEKGRQSSEWGALAYRSQSAVDDLLDRLIAVGLFRKRKLEHGGEVLDLTETGRAALQDPSRLPVREAKQPEPPSGKMRSEESTEQTCPEDDEALFQRLRAWRLEEARARGFPPYVVAHDTVLLRIATSRPRDEAELEAIKGIGPKKLAQYGSAILALVKGTLDQESS